ncbi:hypothetical protein MMU07_09010 [Aquiflexum sp. LQ15W]|uniref:hypothetical protein n=1 Tax=Cognataquiflexum nitidum TaxID=2922272 RepID=UPI001F12C357|nr:hypothetical protein [Cognataquiflexum nitidum]MCH6199718.1 hypothetical protein [Cognataquiflexum nitidum]
MKVNFSKIGSQTAIQVDFKNIEFLSRAAADELLFNQNQVASKGFPVSFINVNLEVNKMLELVRTSYSKEKQANFRFVKWLTFENEQQYEKYLLQF